MKEIQLNIPEGKKIYFASDFHFGVPNRQSSIQRERNVMAWLDQCTPDAAAFYLMGDIFDFWFDYKHAVPKGFTRFLGKLASLTDSGIPVILFTGNHDMWMFDYLEQEIGVKIYREPTVLVHGNHRLCVGHGDGLGPGDKSYLMLKAIFANRFFQWLFEWVHPNIGIAIAHRWSRNSRLSNMKLEEKFQGEDREFILTWCKEIEQTRHHDFYIFGHRHLPLDLAVGPTSRYINLGEWVHFSPYAVYDGKTAELKTFPVQ